MDNYPTHKTPKMPPPPSSVIFTAVYLVWPFAGLGQKFVGSRWGHRFSAVGWGVGRRRIPTPMPNDSKRARTCNTARLHGESTRNRSRSAGVEGRNECHLLRTGSLHPDKKLRNAVYLIVVGPVWKCEQLHQEGSEPRGISRQMNMAIFDFG